MSATTTRTTSANCSEINSECLPRNSGTPPQTREKNEMTLLHHAPQKRHCLRTAPFLVFAVALFAATSCSKASTTSSQTVRKESESTPHRIVIGFSIDTLALERWQRDLD